MAEAKTRKTTASPAAFIARQPGEQTRRDCTTLVRLMEKVTGEKAAMWGPAIVGFGTYHYVYASGQSGDWPVAAFSPRKQALTIYLMPDYERQLSALMKGLGRHKTGKSCLYVKSLADVDLGVLEKLTRASVAETRKMWPADRLAKEGKAPITARPTVKRKLNSSRAVRKRTSRR